MSYTIYQANLEKDKDTILKFWRENQPKPLDQKYKWIYENNPAGKAKVWMVKHNESGQCVGIMALFPRKFSVRGRSFQAGIAGDFLVNKKHRVLKPAIMLQRSAISAADKRDVDFIYGFPNNAAEPIIKRVGYRLLSPMTRLVKIIKTAPQLRKLGLNEYWVNLLSPLLDFLLRLISIETWYRGNRGFICEEVKDFDERFDQLWNREKSQFAIAGERTASYLRWRFIEAPHDAENKVFAIFDSQKSVLKGYIVYRYQHNSVQIRDFLFAEDKKAILVLMTSFLRHVRSLSPDSLMINLLENNNIIQKMKRFGFMKRQSDGNVYLYCTDKVWQELTLSGHPDNWLLMQSDDDTY